jgi:hypothetical protein
MNGRKIAGSHEVVGMFGRWTFVERFRNELKYARRIKPIVASSFHSLRQASIRVDALSP